jgi:hypothetical protein
LELTVVVVTTVCIFTRVFIRISAVEEKIKDIMQCTHDAISSLNTTLKTRLVRLPKSVKRMRVKDVLDVEEDVHASPPKKQHLEDRHQDEQETSSLTYNGLPLQTPMPFAGKPVPLNQITMLTVQHQGKRAGGKTKASREEPRAAVVTTKDGKQWAVGGPGGLKAIPESHRKEVMDILSSQFAFLRDVMQ